MQLSHLEKIALIEQYDSIKQAAQNLNMTQSALSKLISELENELDLTFFIRTARGIILTEEGHEALRLVKNIVAQLDNIHITTGRACDIVKRLTIALPPSLYNALSKDLLIGFKQLYPMLDLHLVEKDTKDGLLAVAKHTCHLAVGSIMPEENRHYLTLLEDLHIAHTILGATHLQAVMSSHDPLAAAESICLADLNDRIVFDYMNDFLPLLSGHMPEELTYTRYKIYDRETLKKLIFLAHGIAIVPETMVWQDHYFESGLLIAKTIRDCEQIPQYCLFYPQTVTISPLDNTFIFMLSQHLAVLTNTEVVRSCE